MCILVRNFAHVFTCYEICYEICMWKVWVRTRVPTFSFLSITDCDIRGTMAQYYLQPVVNPSKCDGPLGATLSLGATKLGSQSMYLTKVMYARRYVHFGPQ